MVLLESHVCNVRMRIFNSDGSEARCAATAYGVLQKYVYEKGIITQPEFSVETRGGVMRPRLNLNRGAVESVTRGYGYAHVWARFHTNAGQGAVFDAEDQGA